MGLAASQARFLGITARKNHCELRSMQIAQEKLSVTNQLSQISEDYQRSLNATKLVWDSEAIVDGSIYDVSYDLLMQPSLLNNYSPQILTNFRNQVVVNNRIAKAIAACGIDPLGGHPRTEAGFNTFIANLKTNGVISHLDSESIQKLSSNYKKDNGLGGELIETFDVKEMDIQTLKRYINTITDPTSAYMTTLRENNKTAIEAGDDNPYDQVMDLVKSLKFGFRSGPAFVDVNGKEVAEQTLGKYIENYGRELVSAGPPVETKTTLDLNTKISDSNFDFADLLEKNVQLSATNKSDFDAILSTFIGQMYIVMRHLFAINPESVDAEYLNFAMARICALVGQEWSSTTHEASGATTPISSSSSASSHTGAIFNGKEYQVSLSNIAKGIMTYFEVAVEGFDSGYNVNSTGKQLIDDSYYVTKDPDYIYFINNPAAAGNGDGDALLQLNFYSQLYNQICANGWTENNLVEDPENLKNMLRNGTLFTSTLSDDGMFYQGPYTSNNFIAEVADEDAIARAEAKFKTEQLKLNALEERLNVDMQLVDAELSALTIEYDTVKQMISKGVEKGFSTLGGG